MGHGRSHCGFHDNPPSLSLVSLRSRCNAPPGNTPGVESIVYNHNREPKADNKPANDISALVKRLADYTGWSRDDPHFIRLNDVHRIFYECLKDQVEAEKGESLDSAVRCLFKKVM